jgi:hypothetical protein
MMPPQETRAPGASPCPPIAGVFYPTLREDQGIESSVIALRGQVVFLRNKAQYGRYKWCPRWSQTSVQLKRC